MLGSSWRRWIWGGLPLLAFAPVLLLYLVNAWYSHATRIVVAAVPLIFLCLAWDARKNGLAESYYRHWVGIALLVTGTALGLIGAWLVSFPLFLWGGLASLLAYLLACCQSLSWTRAGAYTILLGIALPWPSGLLSRWIGSIQTTAAWGLHHALDGLGLIHVRTRSMIELVGLEYRTADRLHGLDGLLALMLLACLISVLFRRSFLHGIGLVISAILWLFLGYFVHGLIISVGHEWYSVFESESSVRYWAGGAVFAGQLLLLFATDFALKMLTDPVPGAALNNETAVTSRTMNGLLSWPGKPVPKGVQPPTDDGHDAKEESNDETVLEEFAQPKEANWNWRAGYWTILTSQVLLVGFGWLMALVVTGQFRRDVPIVVTTAAASLFPEQHGLPTEMGTMKLTYFQRSDLESASEESPLIQTWLFEQAENTAKISLLYPMRESSLWSHELDRDAWTPGVTKFSTEEPNRMGPGKEAWTWKRSEGSGELEGHAYQWICGLEEDLSLHRRSQGNTFFERLRDRFQKNLYLAMIVQHPPEPLYGIRLVVETGDPLTQQELDTYLIWFDVARDRIRDAMKRKHLERGEK